MVASNVSCVQHPLAVLTVLSQGGQDHSALAGVEAAAESLHSLLLATHPAGVGIEKARSWRVGIAIDGSLRMTVKPCAIAGERDQIRPR
jgi:hypothetical protein